MKDKKSIGLYCLCKLPQVDIIQQSLVNHTETIQRAYHYLLKMAAIEHWDKNKVLQKNYINCLVIPVRIKLINLSGIVDKELVNLINEIE